MHLKYNAHIGGGSHLPILIQIVNMTEGPILELGMGLFSTPYLHWVCYGTQRKLVSYESKKEFYDLFVFNDPREVNNKYGFHDINLVENNNWDAIDFSTEHWSVVLVDHAPGKRRKEEVKILANLADYILVHDSDELPKHVAHYKFYEAYPLFKYRYDYDHVFPRTTVLSNFKDVSKELSCKE